MASPVKKIGKASWKAAGLATLTEQVVLSKLKNRTRLVSESL